MNIQPGWLFYWADFTEQAFAPRPVVGTVCLMMDKETRDRYREKHKEWLEGAPLTAWASVTGDGITFEEALSDANEKAKQIDMGDAECESISTTKLTATG